MVRIADAPPAAAETPETALEAEADARARAADPFITSVDRGGHPVHASPFRPHRHAETAGSRGQRGARGSVTVFGWCSGSPREAQAGNSEGAAHRTGPEAARSQGSCGYGISSKAWTNHAEGCRLRAPRRPGCDRGRRCRQPPAGRSYRRRASSVSAEALGEKLVGITGKAAGVGRARPDERECVLPGSGLRRKRSGQFCDHRIDADASSRSLGSQMRERVLRKIDRDGHGLTTPTPAARKARTAPRAYTSSRNPSSVP
jgi:hypothetical protein